MKRLSDKVFVTGASGFVGSNLARRLLTEGYEVHISVREHSDLWRLKDVVKRLHCHPVDLTNERQIKTVIKEVNPELIFHLANIGVYGDVHAPEKNVIETNFLGAVNLLNACDQIDYRCFVNTGSSAEYGPKDHPMKEDDDCQPINVYGISKLAATQYCNILAKNNNKPIVTFRIFSPYGPFNHSSRLITYAILNALDNQPLNLANPNSVRDYIYADDVLDLLFLGVDNIEHCKGQVFNVGGGVQKTVQEVVDNILRLTESTSTLNWNTMSGRSFETKRWEADMLKVSEYFNWSPRYLLEEGLQKTVVWFKDNMSLYAKEVVK